MGDTKHVLRSRVDLAAGAMARAFAEDPVMQWLFQGSEDPNHLLTQFMTLTGNRSVTIGHAYEPSGGQECAGAAFWVPPDSSMFTEEMGIEVFTMIAGAVGQARAEHVLGAIREATDFHPEEPHFYLATVGVDPAHRGLGLGAKLLQRVLRTCDDEQIVAYLESSNPRNISLYERAGFTTITEVRLPDGPTMRPMVRNPNSS